MERSRREFCTGLLGSLATFSILSSCAATPEAISPKIGSIVKHWTLELNEYCGDLRNFRLTPAQWQGAVEKLFARIELSELLKFIDFDGLSSSMDFPDLGVSTANVTFPKLDGLPKDVLFLRKIFGLKRGRAIIPHGHSNMASGHLILKGEFDLRHYEKVAQTKEHLTIRPSIDRKAIRGDFSSISDERDNVHWFVATSDQAFTFDVIMLDLNGKRYDILNLDIDKAVKGSGDVLDVPVIDVKTALKKYGKGAMLDHLPSHSSG